MAEESVEKRKGPLNIIDGDMDLAFEEWGELELGEVSKPGKNGQLQRKLGVSSQRMVHV
jgi:hypothetical protein